MQFLKISFNSFPHKGMIIQWPLEKSLHKCVVEMNFIDNTFTKCVQPHK